MRHETMEATGPTERQRPPPLPPRSVLMLKKCPGDEARSSNRWCGAELATPLSPGAQRAFARVRIGRAEELFLATFRGMPTANAEG